MSKIDLKKEMKHLYGPTAKAVAQVEVPALKYLMVDGVGDPNTSREYQEAVEVLFSVSYTAKFMVKNGPQAQDYSVMPLEGLWWADDMSAFAVNDKARWKWTMMILQPSFVADDIIQAAIAEVRKKKSLPGLDKLRLENFAEGLCAQILHVGPFSEEGPTVERLHEFIDSRSARRGANITKFTSAIYAAQTRRNGKQSFASQCNEGGAGQELFELRRSLAGIAEQYVK